VVLNNRNLGCGAAWNQGALALQSTWTVVMNNDVICARGWLDGLLHAANEHNLQIVSPGMVEGPLDYNFADWVKETARKMKGYCRRDAPHAVCMAIHQGVWDEIGYFLPIPKLLGYDDALFFWQAELSGIKTGTTADSWLHHFGSITQKSLKLEKNLDLRDNLGDRNLARFYMNQSWLERKLARARKNKMLSALRNHELATYQMTVHMLRQNGAFSKK
jgi:N-acetylglucosaminyl-diphospho-decaprenol L-rhamnosyltransferase